VWATPATLAAWLVGTACLITLWMQFGASANNNFAGSDNGQTILNQHFARNSGDTLTLATRRGAAGDGVAPVQGRLCRDIGTLWLSCRTNSPHL
jgi:hypothetical protein